MQTNATFSLYRGGIAYDEDTGYRTSTSETTILSSKACFFSTHPSAKREQYTNGLRQYVKPVFLLMSWEQTEIKVGDRAEVTINGITASYTVNNAEPVGGRRFHWECEVERIETS